MQTESTSLKIHSIEIKNFKCYTNKVSVKFENNLQGIVGLNGSGKSTMISAIEILLRPDIPFPTSNTQSRQIGYCKMILKSFRDDGGRKLELTRDSGNTLFVAGDVVTKDAYKEAIGSINLSSELAALYIIKQNNIDSFLTDDLITLFDRVSGLNEVKDEIETLKENIEKQETDYFRQFQQRKGMQKHREKIRGEQKELDLYKELDNRITELQKDKKEIELKKELLVLKTNIVELQQNSLTSQDEVTTSYNDENRLKNTVKEHNSILKEIDTNQTSLRTAKQSVNTLDENIRRDKAQKLTLFSTIQNMTTKLGEQNFNHFNKKEIIESKAKYSKLLNTLSKLDEAEFEGIKANISDTKELKEITESIAKEETQLNSLRKKLQNNKSDLGRIAEKKNILLADYELNKDELNTIESKLNDRESEREKLTIKEEELKQKQSDLSKIKSDIENRKLLNSEFEELKVNSSLGREDKILDELKSIFGTKKIVGRLESLFHYESERDKFIVANVFGNNLRSIIVKDSESVVEMINFLIQRKYKKEKFVPLTSIHLDKEVANDIEDNDEREEDYSGRVGELVEIKEHSRRFVEAKYKSKLNFSVVKNINEGLSLSQNRNLNCVTEDGTVVFGNGLVKSASYSLTNVKDKRKKLSHYNLQSYEDLEREIAKNKLTITQLQKSRLKVTDELNEMEEEISFLYKTESIDELTRLKNALISKTTNLHNLLNKAQEEYKLKEANISSLERKIDALMKTIKDIESLQLSKKNNKGKGKASIEKDVIFDIYKLINADSEDIHLGFNKDIIIKLINDKIQKTMELEDKRNSETERINELLKSSRSKITEKERSIKEMIKDISSKEKEIEELQSKLRNNYRKLRECQKVRNNLETETNSKKNNRVNEEKENEIKEIRCKYNIKESVDNIEKITNELQNTSDATTPANIDSQNINYENFLGVADINDNNLFSKEIKVKINRLIKICSVLMNKKSLGRTEDINKLNDASMNIEKALSEQMNFFSKLEPNFRVKLDAPEIERNMLNVQKEFMECRKSLNLMKEKLSIKTEERKTIRKKIIEAVINKTKEIYSELSGGGLCTFSYINEKIVYRAMPVGKKSTHATELSGGERTVAALSLIIALSLFKKFSILVLDEIDAALDNSTIERVASLLKRIAGPNTEKQIILVSHKLTMYSKMDSLIGVYYKKENNKTDDDNLVRGVLTLDLSRYPEECN